MFTNSWRPRNFDQPNQDWTTGSSEDPITRLMLNTDLCLFLDIDNVKTAPCCAGEECVETVEPLPKCPMLTSAHARYEAFETVEEMLGGDLPNSNDGPFFDAYKVSWNKATTIGRSNLFPLKESCPWLAGYLLVCEHLFKASDRWMWIIELIKVEMQQILFQHRLC